jgi:hypothetical protein
MKWPYDPVTAQPLDQQAGIAFARQNGTTARPQPPRNLQAQSGSRKILVTWDAPIVADGIVGYKIYTDNENSLLDTLYDPNVRQYSVPASAGSSPPTKNVFISAFSKNSESVKVQIQGKASVEAGAPTDPTVPPASAASGTTGGKLPFDGGDTTGGAGFTR